MRLIIKIEDTGIGFDIQSITVMEALTFVIIKNNPVYYPVLMNLIKDKIVYSFEPKGSIIKVSIRTKYIDTIL